MKNTSKLLSKIDTMEAVFYSSDIRFTNNIIAC